MPIVGYSRASSFSPLSLSPSLWLDASDAATITSAGGLVSQWNDKSGNAKHATATGTAKPTTGVTTQNGLNVLDFEGTNNIMASAASASQPWTAFVVAKSNATPLEYRSAFSGTGVRMYALDKDNSYKRYIFAGSIVYGATVSYTSWSVVAAKINSSSSAVYLNGSSDGTGNAGANALADCRVGGVPENTQNRWKGSIAEIVLYPSALSDANRNAVEAYLRNKWGTP